MDSTKLAAGIAVACALAAAGCGSSSSPPAAKPGFPTTVAAANGSVHIPERPTRIVSISATGTEDLFAVGAGGQVKAVDDYSNFPARAPRTKLSGYQPNPEAIAGYRPDLVVVSDDTNHVVEALDKLHIPVLLDPPATNFAAAYAQLTQLGKATGHLEQARAVVARMRARIAAITKARADTSGPPISVYHELDNSFYSATSKTFVGRVYSLLGLRNIADQATAAGPYPKLSGEYVVRADPDLIVLADTICCKQDRAALAKRTGFARINAVRNGDVLAVPDDVASHWGPRIVDFLALVARRADQIRSRR
jgi:ABC-type Fe3+-hydroxamate transport system substrate-binding protein